MMSSVCRLNLQHIEHAMKRPLTIYVAKVTDRDLVVGILHRFWIPQCMSVG